MTQAWMRVGSPPWAKAPDAVAAVAATDPITMLRHRCGILPFAQATQSPQRPTRSVASQVSARAGVELGAAAAMSAAAAVTTLNPSKEATPSVPMPVVLGNCNVAGRELEMELLSDLDLGSLSDNDLQYLIGDLTEREKAISRERRLLHRCLDVLGVDRLTQTAGVPFDGWVGALVQRENEVSFERSLVQARLDIFNAERKERRSGRSLASLGAEALINALSRQSRRPKPRTADA